MLHQMNFNGCLVCQTVKPEEPFFFCYFLYLSTIQFQQDPISLLSLSLSGFTSQHSYPHTFQLAATNQCICHKARTFPDWLEQIITLLQLLFWRSIEVNIQTRNFAALVMQGVEYGWLSVWIPLYSVPSS